jgi:hypothetical protein
MNPKPFGALLLATVATTILAGFVTWQRSLSEAQPKPPGSLLPLVAGRTDDVNRLTIKTNTYTLNVVRDGDKWLAADRGNFPLRPLAIGSLLTSVASMKPVEPKTALSASYAAIGVSDGVADKGSVELSFGLKDNASAGSLIIGKRSTAMGYDPLGGVFVRTPGERQAWLVQGTLAMPNEFAGFFDENPAYPSTQVQRVRISENGNAIFDAVKENGIYRPAKAEEAPATTVEFANDSNVKKVTAALVSGTFEDVSPASALTFGNESRTVRFEMADGLLIDITVAEAKGVQWARFKAEARAGSNAANAARDINARQANWAYRIASHRIAALTMPVAELTAQPPEEPPQGFPGFQPGGQIDLNNLPPNVPPEFIEQLQKQMQIQQQMQQQQGGGGRP